MKPIRIEGGGISGLALGYALAQKGVPVSLFEKGRYPRHRVCGEFLAGLTPATLKRLELEDLFSTSPIARSVWWFKGKTPVAKHELPHLVFMQSRYALDSKLAHRFVKAGGDLHTGHRIDPRKPAPEGTVRTLGKSSGQSGRLGLKAHFKDLPLEADLEMHLGRQAYVGLSRVEGGYVNVCGLFERQKGLQSKKENWLKTYLRSSGLESLALRLDKASLREGSFCGVSGFAFGIPSSSPKDSSNSLSLGDCHAMIPPFTGNGMTIAFESAALALPWLLDYSKGKRTWEETTNQLSKARDEHLNGRLRRAIRLQSLLEMNLTQNLLCSLARAKLLPLTYLYRILH